MSTPPKKTEFQRTTVNNAPEVKSAAELSRLLDGAAKSPGQYMALCPAHNDHNPSLSIKKTGAGIVLHCFAGCDYKAIIGAFRKMGIRIKASISPQNTTGLPDGLMAMSHGQKYVAHWAYHNPAGEVIAYVVRYESGIGEKSYLPYFQKVNGKWVPGFPGKDIRPIYNQHKIAQSSTEDEIWVVEGEKCADALTKLGVIATTSPNGAGSAGKADWSPLIGRKVVIWPDNDAPGLEYAINVFKKLRTPEHSEPEISVVDIEKLELPPNGDVADWISAGHGKGDLLGIPKRPIGSLLDLGVVEIDEAQIYKAMDKAEDLLMKTAPFSIFRRCGRLFRIVSLTGEEQNIGLMEVPNNYLLDLLNRQMTFVKPKPDGSLAPIDPPSKIVQRYMGRQGHWKLHPLNGIMYAPTLRPDGSVLEQPGYDVITGIYYDNGNHPFPPLKKDVTEQDARTALTHLRHPFQDFPFLSAEDESVLLAAILTAVIRQSLRTAPLFAFNAPVAGSGKTLLADCVSIISTGKQAVTAPQGVNHEEERKHLFATLLQGKPIVLIDNVDRPISSPVLCNILTSPGMYKDRILGRSEMVEVPTRVTFLVTGNNLTFEGDMTRRVLLCTIDPRCENPETRTNFRIKELEEHLTIFRARYVKAALVILKAYVNAGRPKQDIPPYGSFEDWSDWVRSALVWLGCADPTLTRKRIESEDPTKINLGRILTLWQIIYEDDPVKVMNIVHDCNTAIDEKKITSKQYELAQALLEATHGRGRLDNDAVGKYLRKNKDKIQDGYKIIKNPDSPKNRGEWIITRA